MPGEPFNPVRFTRNAVLIGGGIALAAWVWVASAQPNLFPKRFDTVEPGKVYRAGKLTPAAFEQVVRAHEIRTIVDLGAWEEGSDDDLRAARTAEALGVERLRFNLHGDATGEADYYIRALRIMTDPARQPVLIHCGAGTERTGCTIMLYRTVVQGGDADEAYAEAQDAGHSPDRNPKMRPVFESVRPIVEAALSEGG